MSFREKSAWISMLSMSGIYGFYFWSVVHAGPKAGGFHAACWRRSSRWWSYRLC